MWGKRVDVAHAMQRPEDYRRGCGLWVTHVLGRERQRGGFTLADGQKRIDVGLGKAAAAFTESP